MASKRIAAVFFDLDETLINHHWTGPEIIKGIYLAHADVLDGIDPSVFGKTVWRKANDMWHMMYDGILSGEIARVYMFKNALRELELDTSTAESMGQTFESIMLEGTSPSAGAVDVLDALRAAGVKTGIITNGYTVMQRRKIEHHGFTDRVDHIFVSEAVGAHKPDVRIFDHALSTTGARADEAIHVGDHLVNDVEGALDAGLRAALYDPAGDRAQALEQAGGRPPTHVLSRLGEILGVVGLEEPSKAREQPLTG